jgi:heptosyltransferase-2
MSATVRILLRLPNWIGDVVMATPALRAIRAGFPDAEIVAVGPAATLPMLAPARWFDHSLPAPRERGLAAHVRFGRALRAEGFAVAFLLPNSFSSALQAFVARIPRRIGYVQSWRGLLLTDRLRTRRIGRLRPIAMSEYYLAMARLAGCPVERTGRHLELPVTEEARARAEASFARRGVAAGESVVALNVGAGFGSSKLWTVEGWAACAAHWAAAGRRVMVLGGPAERPLVDEILAAGAARGASSGMFGATDIPLADLGAHLARCALLVSTDSGVRSMGVAVGVPTVCVMGPTHPAYSEVGVGRYAVVLEKVECWPCHLKVCPIDHRCMRRIEAARVIAAGDDFLAGREPMGGARPWVTRAGEESAHFALA